MRRQTLLIVLAAAAVRRHSQRRPVRRELRVRCGAYGNHSWDGVAAGGISARRVVRGSRPDGQLRVGGGARVPDGAHRARDVHRAVRDDDRRLHAHPPADLPQRRAGRATRAGCTRSTSSAARCSPAPAITRTRPATASTPRAAGTAIRRPTSSCRGARSRARASRRSPATRGNAKTLQIAVGCYNGTVNTACTVAAGGGDRQPDLRRAGRAQRPDAAGRLVEADGPAGRRAPRGLRRRSRSTPATTAASGASRSSTSAAAGRRRRRGLGAGAPHDERRDLLVPPPQGLPEPQERDRPADGPGRRAADAQGPRHRRRQQRDRAGPLPGGRRHAVGPRPVQRQRRDRGRLAERALRGQATRRARRSATASASRSPAGC